jgi:hypothetical protein
VGRSVAYLNECRSYLLVNEIIKNGIVKKKDVYFRLTRTAYQESSCFDCNEKQRTCDMCQADVVIQLSFFSVDNG